MLDFDAMHEGSYDALMTIVNKSHVGLISIGTDEATQKLYSYWHTSRRAGVHVPADEYCWDPVFVSAILAKLWRYRFFDHEIPLTADIIKAYKDCSGGTVEKLISIHKEVITDYILNGKKATVDGDYIRSVAYRKWKDLEGIIEKKSIEEEIIKAKFGNDQEEMNRKLKELEHSTTKIVASMKEDNRWNDILAKVRTTLEVTGGCYNQEKIELSMAEVMRLKSFNQMDDAKAAHKVLAHLEKRQSDKRAVKKSEEAAKEEFDKNGITFRG